MVELGDCVWIVDGHHRYHLALVTKVMVGPNGPEDMPWVHAAYVTPDEHQLDEYGRPITRITSVPFLGADVVRKVWWTSVIMEELVEA